MADLLKEANMLKYTLRIEGSAEELEQAKDIVFNLTYQHIHGQYKECITPPIATGFVTEYITREPKYRVKSLGELAAEFGDKLELTHGGRMMSVNGLHPLGVAVDLVELSPPYVERGWGEWCPGDLWKKTFLKEV